MPSTWRRTRHRALTLTRSIAQAIRSTFSRASSKQQTCPPFSPITPYLPTPKPDIISRPRQLRRGWPPDFPYRRIHLVHRLPPELLAHVFVLAAEDDFMLPVTVSHVCRAWRVLSLGTPELWRRVTLTANLDMWEERIARARACTLDVQLLSWCRTGGGYPRHQFLDADAVVWRMHLATPLIRRWRSLEIVLSEYSPYLWNAVLSGACERGRKTKAAALEQLTLVYRLNDDTKEFLLFSGRAPKLRHVTLDGIRLTWMPSLYADLTYLDYTHHGFTVGHEAVNDIICMLEVSGNLKELHLLFPRKPFVAAPTRSRPVKRRVVLPALTTLHLRIEGPDIPFELAHVMTLVLTPCLLSMRLVDLQRSYHSFPSLKSFFYVYSLTPSLRHLHIEHGWYDHGMIAPMLRSLPELRQVVVRRPYAPDHVLDLHTQKRKKRGTTWTGHQQYHHAHSHIHPVWTMQRR